MMKNQKDSSEIPTPEKPTRARPGRLCLSFTDAHIATITHGCKELGIGPSRFVQVLVEIEARRSIIRQEVSNHLYHDQGPKTLPAP